MDSIFMKVNGLDGSATSTGFEKQIGLLSMNHKLNLNVFAGGGTEGRTSGSAKHSDVSVTKIMDINSVKFNEYCCNATSVPDVTITVCRQEGNKLEPLVVYTLNDVIVSSYNISASGGNPVETVTLNYAKIKWEFTNQDQAGKKSGNVAASWDLKKNSPQS